VAAVPRRLLGRPAAALSRSRRPGAAPVPAGAPRGRAPRVREEPGRARQPRRRRSESARTTPRPDGVRTLTRLQSRLFLGIFSRESQRWPLAPQTAVRRGSFRTLLRERWIMLTRSPSPCTSTPFTRSSSRRWTGTPRSPIRSRPWSRRPFCLRHLVRLKPAQATGSPAGALAHGCEACGEASLTGSGSPSPVLELVGISGQVVQLTGPVRVLGPRPFACPQHGEGRRHLLVALQQLDQHLGAQRSRAAALAPGAGKGAAVAWDGIGAQPDPARWGRGRRCSPGGEVIRVERPGRGQ